MMPVVMSTAHDDKRLKDIIDKGPQVSGRGEQW